MHSVSDDNLKANLESLSSDKLKIENLSDESPYNSQTLTFNMLNNIMTNVQNELKEEKESNEKPTFTFRKNILRRLLK